MSPLSEAKRRANKKWDAANMQNLSVKLRREYAEEIRQACQEEGTTPGAVMRAALDSFMEDHRARQPRPAQDQPSAPRE